MEESYVSPINPYLFNKKCFMFVFWHLMSDMSALKSTDEGNYNGTLTMSRSSLFLELFSSYIYNYYSLTQLNRYF